MRHQRLRSAICLLLFWQTSFVDASEQFLVTERDSSGFVVEQLADSAEFVVTDRPAMAANPTVASRPIVWLYSAKWCAPCRAARQELERAQLPFEIRIVDVTQGGQPEYVDGIPYFEWKSPRGRWFARWTSVSDLIKRWELTH